MPQMAPMSWSLLFLFFSIMLILVSSMNYYLFYPKTSTNLVKKEMTTQNHNWKW